MKQIEGGICAVRGVSANGIKAGKMGIDGHSCGRSCSRRLYKE